MSYRTQAQLARDNDLMLRVAACAATQDIKHPEAWAWEHNWDLSAEPGWDDAYKYALDTNVASPGNNDAVVNDGMILAAVQALIAAETPAGN